MSNDNDKFINKENPFEKLEFEVEIDQRPLTELEQALIENEAEAHKEKTETKKVCGADEGLKAQELWFSLFNEVLLEVFDTEKAFEDICANFTQSLLDKGIQVSPHAVYQTVEMANTRMMKIAMSKRLAHAHGLHYEWPQILAKELDVMYGSRGPVSKIVPIKGNPVGEAPS